MFKSVVLYSSCRRYFGRHRLIFVAAAFWGVLGEAANAFQVDDPRPDPAGISSPNKVVSVDFTLTSKGRPSLIVNRKEATVATVILGLDFAKSGRLSENMVVFEIGKSEHDETYAIPVGKRSSARDHHHELTIRLHERDVPFRKLNVVIRAFDDGIAFRYDLPEQTASDFTITHELTEYRFNENLKAHLLPLNSYTSAYEAYYQAATLKDVPVESIIGLPLLMESNREETEPLWVAVTEAGLTDYAGMYLQRHTFGPQNDSSGLVCRLSPIPGRTDDAKVLGQVPFQSPWRVIMIADGPERFLESDLIFHLNEPSRIDDPSWIRPGKTTFPWWNGYVLNGIDFEAGVNTATMKHYIDFCAENGIPYHSLDGLRIAWYGGPIRPSGPVDITTADDSINLQEVLKYARGKGVRIRLWVHWKALKPQLDHALATYEQWGVEGIMVDFMNRDDQEMVRWYHEVARKAAKHHLTVTWHGAYKPTGMERTWPNVLSYEAVRNQEYNKWTTKGLSPEHNLNVAFIRSVAGPLDYHQGAMRNVDPQHFRAQDRSPLVLGTRCHQLAMYIVYQNHLSMMADSPGAYRNQPDLKFFVDIPTNWDETRVLRAEFGQCIIVARRNRETWYVGGMAAGKAQSYQLPLSFLNSDTEYRIELLLDDQTDPKSVKFRNISRSSSDQLNIQVQPDGGFAARMKPQ